MEEDDNQRDALNDSGGNASGSDSGDDVQVIPTPSKSGKDAKRKSVSAAAGSGGDNSPATPSGTKKRKRLSMQEREEKEKERAEKRAKLEEEKQKKEDERQKREEEKRKKEEEKQLRQQQKEQERLKKEEEKRKKQEEDERKRKEKEEEKKRKIEEEEKRKKEKEEEKRLKELEKKKKLEEEERKKKEREEERLKKLEEKEQKEQERLKKLEEQEKEKRKGEEQLAKQAKLLQNFFKSPAVTKSPAGRRAAVNSSTGDKIQDVITLDGLENDGEVSSKPKDKNAFNPMMFEVKSFMALAPLLRRPKLTASERAEVDRILSNSENCDEEQMDVDDDEEQMSYLQQLKSKGGRRFGRTEVVVDTEADVQIITDTIENPKAQGLVKWRYKLLQFHTNQRPAYWGTYKKRSEHVTARKPLGKETDFDYEFDSDDEWEEEPEDAEDLGASDKEDDTEKEAEEEEDDEDGWLVPHGYLSDDEGAMDEHLDKEELKENEKEYFEGLKKQPKIKYPEIQTDRLLDFKIVLCPLNKKWKEQSKALKAASLNESVLPARTEEAA